LPPLITQIWDGQIQGPPETPVPNPASVNAASHHAPIWDTHTVPAPAPTQCVTPLPLLVSEIFDGQLQAPQPTAKATALQHSIVSKSTERHVQSSVVHSPSLKPSPGRTHPVSQFHSTAGRVVVGGAAVGWVALAAAMGLVA
jgi:hypothetical protein